MAVIIIVCSCNEVLNATNARVCAQLGAIFGGIWTIESSRSFVVQLLSIFVSPLVTSPPKHSRPLEWSAVVCTYVCSFYYCNSICCSLCPFDVTFMGLSDSFIFAKKGPKGCIFIGSV